jgi:very-short-patch-repair endonuclease
MNGSTADRHSPDTASEGLAFIKAVAKYFMDFLETDFHKKRTPKRAVKFRSDRNFLIGINLSKYSSFTKRVWQTIHQGFQEKDITKVKKGTYQTSIPVDLLQLTRIQCQKLTTQQLQQMVDTVAEAIEKAGSENKTEYDQALITALDSAETIIKDQLVQPFIAKLEKPLKSLNLGDEAAIRLMEDELSTIFVKASEDKIAHLMKLLVTGELPDIRTELGVVFDLGVVKRGIEEFFQTHQIKDLYAELYEIDRNKHILDKQDTYLYFYDILFQNTRYPVFYIPFSIERDKDVLRLDFDSQVYINKKALGYIVQEYNERTGKKGSLTTIGERIRYLSQYKKNDFSSVVKDIIDELVDFFELDCSIDTANPGPQVAKSPLVRVSNSCYINMFETSDEALINDYEEILHLLSEGDSVLGSAFNRLIEDFIHREPLSFNSSIEEEWDDASIGDRLVFETPIPLNSEQRQILAASRKEGCKYITVEGPPGTGKSHTITAIVFDAILEGRAVLVLSDKKEALDVVEDKITETMNRVRLDKNFQNPILRLGKTGNTYSQILSTQSIQKIKAHHTGLKKHHNELSESIKKLANTIKEDLEAEVLAYGEVDIAEVAELCGLELYYEQNDCIVDLKEALDTPDSADGLHELREVMLRLQVLFDGREKHQTIGLLDILGISVASLEDLVALDNFLGLLAALLDTRRQLEAEHSLSTGLLAGFSHFSDADIEELKSFVKQYEGLKNWLFGYFFNGGKVERLNVVFRQSFPHSGLEHPHKNLAELNNLLGFLNYTLSLKRRVPKPSRFTFDYLKVIHALLRDKALVKSTEKLINSREDVHYLEQLLKKYHNALKDVQIDSSKLNTLWNNLFLRMSDRDFDRMVRYINLNQRVTQAFSSIPSVHYGTRKQEIERLVTSQMTYLLDGRVVDFYENSKATAKALKAIIKNKERFPKSEFAKLKSSFPCILAGIRDYAEYIPLAPEIFDLVIIDEASQVSVAQAFPALLRAKKVIILGDKKQFSNVKSAQARSVTNKEYLNKLEHSFRTHVSQEAIKLVKLQKFDIKTSILEFFEFITNFNIQLMKHFRGYKELISYSNKYFYQNSLQVMKIRGKAIDDVLKFSFLEHDGKQELTQNTNKLEIDFIISELRQLRTNGNTATVGIITPHTNQQKLAMEMISALPEKDYLFDTHKLKIMTFDTCQGEERDIIFHSMVATNEADRLWGVFIKDLSGVDLEEEGKIKAQRLNVGFSRARECMHFVLSKQLETYSGAIADALRHYWTVLQEAKKEKPPDDVDQRSPMERAVLNWFYQTPFWEENKDNIDFTPGFKIGKYLRQLDKTYNHPAYVVDFLLVYRKDNQEHKIIIEYDGFKEHFQDVDWQNEFRHNYYYSQEDVYREKVLEGYGYRFLRINRFNIGTDPITTLNDRIQSLTKKRHGNKFQYIVNSTIEGLQDGRIRQCPKCKLIRDSDDFRDPTLTSGWGKICKQCKEKGTGSRAPTNSSPGRSIKAPVAAFGAGFASCPKCGSRMVLRNGRHGPFWGCPRFPYCRGTRNL